MKEYFQNRRFGNAALSMIAQCNTIIESYQAQGYTLTLRQLYYQLVSRDVIPNQVKAYNNLGALINDARLAGKVDWDAIEDRGRYLRQHSHWESPAEIVESCAAQYRVDLWAAQEHRPEVWVEKDALLGVIAGPCKKLDVPYFACRGYTSVTALYETATRFKRYQDAGQTPIVIHLGDHDPSGIDMTRDIRDRLEIFGIDCEVNRVALNMDQVKQYDPPPNPAKQADSRYAAYLRAYGDDSWELDALEPSVLDALIERELVSLIDTKAWKKSNKEQKAGREKLQEVANTI